MNVLRSDIGLFSLAAFALCAGFLGKAFHIDDALVVWTAQWILLHPVDFYGYPLNWYGYVAPMHVVNQNPPGAAYLAAVAGSVLGFEEWAMHAWVALAFAALVVGVYLLARSLGGSARLSAGLALGMPGIFVSATTVMTDLPMAALWVWAVALWVRGLEARRGGGNAAAAVLVAAALLNKYFAVSLVPLLAAYTLLSGRRHWRRLGWLLLPVVALGAYELLTWRLYGVGHFWASFAYAEGYQSRYGVDAARKLLSGLAFLGAGAAPAVVLAPWLFRGAGRVGLVVAAMVAAGVVAGLAAWGWQPGEQAMAYPWWFWAQYALWVWAGTVLLGLLLAEMWEVRDPAVALLALWIVGTLVFGMFINHFVNMRVILPALPAVALLVGRRARRLSELGEAPPRAACAAAVMTGILLSLAVGYADLRLANAGREAAERIAPEARGGRTWFSGHWGFQHYMEARGALPIDQERVDLQPGDTVVTPENATNRIAIDTRGQATDQSFALPVCEWLTTMRRENGAGFYADVWGPLPFVFGPVLEEKYEIVVLNGPNQ